MKLEQWKENPDGSADFNISDMTEEETQAFIRLGIVKALEIAIVEAKKYDPNIGEEKEMKRDCGEKLIVEDLSWHYHNFNEKLKNKQVGFWSYEWEEEEKKLKKMTKALKRVLAYYGEKV
jgi:hypothetical protein